MEAAREGYHRGVRAVLTAASERGWGLKGAVAELIRVTEELETAIEIALGGAAQNVVARRDEDAKAAIVYLKETKAGRATFLPLNSLRLNPLPAEAKRALERIAGVIGVASDLVEVEEECRPAIEYLLGRVVVTRDLDAALAVSRQVRGVSRAVTLDGDLVVPGGAMTGGSRPVRSEGLIARGRQLEELAVAIAEEKERADELAKRLAVLDEKRESLRAKGREADERRRQLEIERISAERDVQEARRNAERTAREKASVEQQLERMAEAARRRAEELVEIKGEWSALLDRRDETAKALEMLENELVSGRGDQDDLRRQGEELRLTRGSQPAKGRESASK